MFLSLKYIQFWCCLCSESTGEFADISCGDPWYREIKPNEHGWSLVLVRTKQGKEILRKAIKAGYVKLKRVDPSTVPDSQQALLRRRRHLWGRLLVMQMMRVPVPRYRGFSLFRNWLRLSAIEKLRSFGGTLKRIVSRRWMRPSKPIIKGDGLHEADSIKRALMSSGEFESQCKV